LKPALLVTRNNSEGHPPAAGVVPAMNRPSARREHELIVSNASIGDVLAGAGLSWRANTGKCSDNGVTKKEVGPGLVQGA